MSEKTRLNKKVLIGAVAVIAIALVTALAIFLPKSAEAKKLTEQLNLGDKYLSELNYEQAVVSYLAAIEIDPKNADAYLGLADAYIAQGEYDEAIKVLEDALAELGEDAVDVEPVKDKLAEAEAAKNAAEDGTKVTSTPEPTEVPVENTPALTATSTPVPTATSTPTPTATSTPTPSPTPAIYEAGNFKWRYNEEGNVTIVGVIDRSVTELTIPDSIEGKTVTELGVAAFRNCMKIQELKVPEGVTTIGNWSFHNCQKIVKVELPASIKEIGEHIFQHCNSLEEIILAEENQDFVMINGGLYTKDLKTFYCFPSQRQVDAYEVENGVEKISAYAFYQCNITEIVLPDTVTIIDKYAFCQSDVITKINLPDSITYIGKWAFANCDNLSVFSMPKNLREISEMAFYKCAMNSVEIPAGVEIIGEAAFRACENLTEIAVAEGNLNYRAVNGVLYDKDMKTLLAFPAGYEIERFEIPSGVERIGYGAFDHCLAKEIIIPDTVSKIGDDAFWNCHAIDVLKLPKSVIEIGDTIVMTGVYMIEIAEDNPVYKNVDEYVLSKDGTLLIMVCRKEDGKGRSYTLPDGIKIIGENAFEVANNVEEIILPNGVEEIRSNAFYNCPWLTKIYIPETVNTIDSTAFYNSNNVTIITPSGSYAETWASEKNIPVENQ